MALKRPRLLDLLTNMPNLGECFPKSEEEKTHSLPAQYFYVASCLAEGLVITWLASTLLYIGIGLPGASDLPQTGRLTLYLLFLGCAAVSCALLRFRSSRSQYHPVSLIMMGITAAVLCAGPFILPWAVPSQVLIFISVGASGVGSACLIALLSVSLGSFSHGGIVFSTPIVMLFAGILTSLLYYAQPQIVQLCYLAGVPIIAAALSLGSWYYARAGNNQLGVGSNTNTNNLDWRASGAVIAHEACIGFGIYSVVSLCNAGREEVLFACSVVVDVIAIITWLFAINPKARENYFGSERLQLKFTLPLAALGIAPMLFVGSVGKIICCAVLFAAFTPQIITNINALAENVRIGNLNPIETFCGGYIANFAGLFIGTAFACVAFSLFTRGLLLGAGALEFALLVLLMLLSAVFFANRYPHERAADDTFENNQPSDRNGHPEEIEHKLSWRDRCGIVADTYQLSPRQSQVLFLLSRGYANKSIEEQLSISNHTVKSHIAAIYQKTGVHSKQEIIDLVNNVDEV